MATGISRWLRRRSTGPITLVAAVVFGLFIALVLPRQAARAEQSSGSAESPDTAFWYAPDDLYRMAEDYGPDGRAAYVRARWSFDVVWPLVYTAFLATALSWLQRTGAIERGLLGLANLCPLLGMLFDFGENSATSLVMARYPAPTPIAAWLAPPLTALKWVFVNGSFGLLLVLAVLAAVAWIGRRRPA
jgi:hypothetical protein